MSNTEAMRSALEDIVRHCKKNGMQDWPIAVKARAALAQAEQRQEFNGLTPQETNASASIMGMVDKQASGVSYEDEYLMTPAAPQPEEFKKHGDCEMGAMCPDASKPNGV